MEERSSIRIVIADDHAIFCAGLKRLLEDEPDLSVVGVAADGDEAVALALEHRPDVLLLDLAMPKRSGAEVLRAVTAEAPAVKVIVLAAVVTPAQKMEALELGARGFILKESTTTLLLKCIRTVMAGQYWVGRDAVSSLVEGLRQARGRLEPHGRRFGLTRRQLEIVRAVAGGSTNKAIAAELGISEDTVKQHLSSIFDKCGVSTRVELAMFAVNHELAEES